jgi:hypothetical protein
LSFKALSLFIHSKVRSYTTLLLGTVPPTGAFQDEIFNANGHDIERTFPGFHTDAPRKEIFAATAAFVAVQVVYIGSVGGGGQ